MLRRFTLDDLERFVMMLTDERVTDQLSFPKELKTAGGAEALLRATIAAYESDEPMVAFAIASPDGFLRGMCGVSTFAPGVVEIFYAVAVPEWRRRIGSRAAKALVRALRRRSDVEELVGFVLPDNQASRRILEGLGFEDRGLVERQGFAEPVHDYRLDLGG